MHSFRDFTPDLRLQWMSAALALSADGNLVAYADDASGRFNVTVQGTAADGAPRRQITRFTDRAVQRIVWNPDGRSLIFTADLDGDENDQIFSVDLAGGPPVALTDAPGARHALAVGDPFSPDGRYLAYTANDREPGEQDVLIRDLGSGQTRRIYDRGGRVFAGDWSPDGKWLTIADWREGSSDHIVYVVAADGGSVRRVTPEEPIATYFFGPWLRDGSGVLVVSNAGREFTGLGALDVGTGEVAWLDNPPGDVEDVALSADGRTVAWLVNIDAVSELRVRDLGSGADLPVPALPMAQAKTLRISADGSMVVCLMSTASSPWNVIGLNLRDQSLRRLTEARPVAVDPAVMVDPVVVRFPSADGTQVPAFLYLPPPSVRVERPLGVLMSIHGGPVWQERPYYQRDGLYQYLLSRGIAVFTPNVRGSTGYGKSYQYRIYRDWGGVDLEDFAAAVEWLHAQDWVDAGRIGLYGSSYGGFAVLSCVSRLPHVNWAAAVDIAGISNLVTLTNTSPPTWRSKVAAIIGDPATDEQFLRSRSPITYADQIRAPLLVIQGANDPRVPQQEADQIVAELRRRDVEVAYLLYPDEGHGLTKAKNKLEAESAAAEFLITHLSG